MSDPNNNNNIIPPRAGSPYESRLFNRESDESLTHSIWQGRPKSQHFYTQNHAATTPSSASSSTAYLPLQSQSQGQPQGQPQGQVHNQSQAHNQGLAHSSKMASSFFSNQSSPDSIPGPGGSPSISSFSSILPPGTFKSRARAGTLPSRLSGSLFSNTVNNDPSYLGQVADSTSSPSSSLKGLHIDSSNHSLGSLALLSPDGQSPIGSFASDISPPVPLPNISSSSQPFHSLFATNPPTATTTSSSGSSSFLNVNPLDSPSSSSSSQQRSSLPPPVTSRLRSGSLNILSESRPSSYASPFGSSIWSSQKAAGSQDSSKRLSQQSLLNTIPSNSDLEESLDEAAHHEQKQQSAGRPVPDPMQPFLSKLAMRTDPSRMRSYTINNTANNVPYGLSQFDDMSVADSAVDNRIVDSSNISLHQQYEHTQLQQNSHISQQSSAYSPQHEYQQYAGNTVPATIASSTTRPRAQTTSGASFDLPVFSFLHGGAYANDGTIPTSFDDPSIGPTRSLWIYNIPASTSSYTLQAIFSAYGAVESTRVLTNKNCGFVNFVNIDSAIQALTVLNDKELFPGTGPCRVTFAKVQQDLDDYNGNNVNGHDTSASNQQTTLQPSATQPTSENIEYNSNERDTSPALEIAPETIKSLNEISDEMTTIVRELGATDSECKETISAINRALNFKDFKAEIPPVPEARVDRVYDAPTLREVRKRMDSGTCSQDEIEEIAIDLLDEIAELSSDYVGNTVVQKLFDTCSEPIKDLMLKQIAPYLAQIGVHKNGTWAAQKIIDVAHSTRQMDIIADTLRPYTVYLFLDQFGNYVIQCCLRFGTPWNDFIFETILSQFGELAQGRFGARAMRACLESHYVSKNQQRMVAAAIVMHSVQLATNSNGALLLTWFLDTYTLPDRHSILAPRLIPNLAQLCTHKLASLTVLKVINHKAEPMARQLIFEALFTPNDENPGQVLIVILNHAYGPTFIYKVISAPFIEGFERQNAINKIRSVLISIKAQPSQGYKRLMDEVGLTTRSVYEPSSDYYNSNIDSGSSNRQSSGATGNVGGPAGANGPVAGGNGTSRGYLQQQQQQQQQPQNRGHMMNSQRSRSAQGQVSHYSQQQLSPQKAYSQIPKGNRYGTSPGPRPMYNGQAGVSGIVGDLSYEMGYTQQQFDQMTLSQQKYDAYQYPLIPGPQPSLSQPVADYYNPNQGYAGVSDMVPGGPGGANIQLARPEGQDLYMQPPMSSVGYQPYPIYDPSRRD